MLYIFKLVCLLLKYKKIGYIVNIKTSTFSTEKTAMLYIRNRKISELSVECIATCQSKLLHLGVIYLPSKGRKRFREKLPWFGESKRTPSGCRVTEFQYILTTIFFLPTRANKERRTGKIRGAFLGMHMALDGWMLARAPASPAQGLHHYGPRYFNFPYFCTIWGFEKLGLVGEN